jgi:hypothetical protein
VLALLAIVACAPAVPAFAAAAGRVAATTDAQRAVAGYGAMQRYLFDSRSGRYRETVAVAPGSDAWPFSQALAAAIGVAALPSSRAATDVPKRLQTLESRFRSGSVYTAWPGGDVYLDDNEWIAEDLLDWSALRSDLAARNRAAGVFAAAVRAWDANPSHPCAGGVFWTTAPANRDRNTVSTANAALVGLRLYAATGRPSYLAWSKRMLAWLDRCMRAPNGLYWDHVALDGTVDRTQWSYNQGAAVGAFVELYATTHNAAALARAEQLADATLDHFADRWQDGEPPEFAAIFFRNLLVLAAADGRRAYVAAAQSYADRAWSTAHDSRTGLYSFGGPTRLLDQAAVVQLYAALARTGG